ncbi:3D domain-containing protein [Patescibacteria group bacterium]|nr:3D domain-containing protein [Patescibacteria group bacterium]MBU1673145.1 3D domain-containing protein [Patescibacteria group bacterium]MBU1963399.1 3D domain-containing protein [Patescibacteria group bacterium]
MLVKKLKNWNSKHGGKVLYFALFMAIAYNVFVPGEIGHADEPEYAIEYHEQAIPQNHLPEVGIRQPREVLEVSLTAYSSTPDQTSGNPFVTASGARVHDGTIAANCLEFGTRVKFPELYGDKVFVVEDRLAARMGCSTIDIWFDNRGSAMQFGRQYSTVHVL